jgi:hypothetical protein
LPEGSSNRIWEPPGWSLIEVFGDLEPGDQIALRGTEKIDLHDVRIKESKPTS